MGSRDRRSGDRGQESAGEVLKSMAVSLVLVGLTFAFVIGFRYFLKSQTYRDTESTISGQEQSDDTLVPEEDFDIKYLMVKNVSDQEEFCATKEPGVVEEDSARLKNGQILEVRDKGLYKDKTYYRLKDGTYVQGLESKILEIRDYLPLTGYIAITYISSGGVRLRSWVDFEDDNVVKSVYVGDKVNIEAMVTTTEDVSAFRTDEGLYITTNPQYFTDYTNLNELEKAAREAAEAEEAAARAEQEAAEAEAAKTAEEATADEPDSEPEEENPGEDPSGEKENTSRSHNSSMNVLDDSD